ncbi:tyrosine-type recombinase/integrase [Chromobacterium sphagni]|uniref:tyrosine-type recombinase/integrase n=1 Tax=Chromobacterium sphagni TaxID=1903179 RepID=UPI003B985D75
MAGPGPGRLRTCHRAKGAITVDAVRKIVSRAGREGGLTFPVHPHMLRHATGFKLANDGQDTRATQNYLGHRAIQHEGVQNFV